METEPFHILLFSEFHTEWLRAMHMNMAIKALCVYSKVHETANAAASAAEPK